MAKDSALHRCAWLVIALLGIMIWFGLLVTARKPHSDQEYLEARTVGHLKDLHEESRRRHFETEALYWEARALANDQRQQLPDWALTGSATNLGGETRIWDYYTPDYNCPLLKQRVGRIGDGGKWVCGLKSNSLQTAGCLVYSLGSAGDTSFEEVMINKTACEVHTFDPTLSPEVETAVQSKEKLHFHPIGVGNPEAHGGDPLKETLKLEKLEAIMSRLQHTWIDVLKIDIEGFEWELLMDFYKLGARLPATQILMEVHFPGLNKVVWEVFDMLLADKYRIFSVEPNYYCQDGCCAKDLLEFAFIKVSDHGQICAPKESHGDKMDAVVLAEAC